MGSELVAESRPRLLDNLRPVWPVEELKREGLWFNNIPIESYPAANTVRTTAHGEYNLLGSYSYLGLNMHPHIQQAVHSAIDKYGSGTHGARLLAGTLDLHFDLESAIAKKLGCEDAILFSSGYAANISCLSAVLTANSLVIADRKIHASLVDGIVLSGANLVRFAHNNPAALEACLAAADVSKPILVVIDGVYSMEGDIAPLPEILRLCEAYGAALMVDEAHSFAVLGKSGGGICEHFGVDPQRIDILMGTLSKALPSSGGFIAGSRRLCDLLRVQGRGFVYSGALSPANTAAALAALQVLEMEPERLSTLRTLRNAFDALLKKRNIPVIETGSPIVPILCGDDWTAWRTAASCRGRGVLVHAIISPVVPRGRARLRAAVNCNQTLKDIEHFAEVIDQAFDENGTPRAVGGP